MDDIGADTAEICDTSKPVGVVMDSVYVDCVEKYASFRLVAVDAVGPIDDLVGTSLVVNKLSERVKKSDSTDVEIGKLDKAVLYINKEDV